ncbi:MAG: hypothetical protein CENE_00715 [Candidatus Celerinatantimonas neptuna]|nr:MAG: hypothetical protein CENE_00715 [Candidatus Celerinatantimonas neptuna]
MENLEPTEYEKILQKDNIQQMGDWNSVGNSKPSHISFTPIEPDNWQKNFPFVGYTNQLTDNGNLNISSTSSAVIKMKLTDTDNPVLDKLFTNQKHENSASVIENTTHGIDFLSGRSLSGIASGGFSTCAFQAT